MVEKLKEKNYGHGGGAMVITISKVKNKDKKELQKEIRIMGLMSSPAWTRKEGKNPKGGLNAKGRASYNKGKTKTGKKRNLKAPSKVKGNKRRKSFCARMKGMKKKLTSKKTARDPNSRINKSLRAWNC